jgi:hypothetical protein
MEKNFGLKKVKFRVEILSDNSPNFKVVFKL